MIQLVFYTWLGSGRKSGQGNIEKIMVHNNDQVGSWCNNSVLFDWSVALMWF